MHPGQGPPEEAQEGRHPCNLPEAEEIPSQDVKASSLYEVHYMPSCGVPNDL